MQTRAHASVCRTHSNGILSDAVPCFRIQGIPLVSPAVKAQAEAAAAAHAQTLAEKLAMAARQVIQTTPKITFFAYCIRSPSGSMRFTQCHALREPHPRIRRNIGYRSVRMSSLRAVPHDFRLHTSASQ